MSRVRIPSPAPLPSDQVLARLRTPSVQNVDPTPKAATGVEAHNTSRLTLKTILADPPQVADNLRAWIAKFDPETRVGRVRSSPRRLGLEILRGRRIERASRVW